MFLFCVASRCIGAIAVLEWDANSETNVTGYKVCWGQASRDYNSVSDVGNVTTWRNDFAIGHHCLAVTAYDTDGLESDLSEELSLEIVAPPVLRFESNTLTWAGTGLWQMCWTTDLSTNRQIVFTNRVALGMFPAGCMISVRRYEFGATNVLSEFAAPLSFNPPAIVRAIRIRVLLQKSRSVNEPFTDFAEAPFFDNVSDQSIYRARLDITQTGLRLR
jgi:hypothetical protein